MSVLQDFSNLLKDYQTAYKELNKCSGFQKRNFKTKENDLTSFLCDNIIEEDLSKELELLVKEAARKFHNSIISSFHVSNNRISLKLVRSSVIKSILLEVNNQQSTYGSTETFKCRKFKISCTECKDELTVLRMTTTARAVVGLITLGGGVVSKSEHPGECEALSITHTANSERAILVSSVKVPGAPGITKDAFIRLRTEDMLAVGDHKDLCEESVNRLVEAAIIFDLLSVKLEKPLLLDVSSEPRQNRISNSKGGAFVIYNYARLCAILEKFYQCVKKGIFPPLPSLEDIDYSLYTAEDEWSLVYDQLAEWPAVLRDCQDLRQPRLHRVTGLLSSLAATFSIYYRHTRVLNDGKPHMIPLMTARIHLLLAIKQVFEIVFTLLGITAPTSM